MKNRAPAIRPTATILAALIVPAIAWGVGSLAAWMATGPLSTLTIRASGMVLAGAIPYVAMGIFMARQPQGLSAKQVCGEVHRMGMGTVAWTGAWWAVLIAAGGAPTLILPLAIATIAGVFTAFALAGSVLPRLAIQAFAGEPNGQRLRGWPALAASLMVLEIGVFYALIVSWSAGGRDVLSHARGDFSWMLLAPAFLAVGFIYFLVFLDVWMSVIAALPVIGGLLVAAGTCLIRHEAGDGALPLAIGMGTALSGHYPLWLASAQQRYRGSSERVGQATSAAVILSGACSALAFFCLTLTDDPTLEVAGMAGGAAVLVTAVAALAIVPRQMQRYFDRNEFNQMSTANWQARVRRRYRHLGPFPRIFACIKLRTDPLFEQLREIVGERADVGVVLDIGCGFGVPACALAEWFDDARVYGLDPAYERTRIASLALGSDGQAVCGQAPDLEVRGLPEQYDTIIALDMCHFLDGEGLATMFRRVGQLLAPGGRLIMRAVVPHDGQPSMMWRWIALCDVLNRRRVYHRPLPVLCEAMRTAGLAVDRAEVMQDNHEMAWCVACKRRADQSTPT